MLEPLDRRNLLDLLRPPAGYDLDTVLGTTFSLDLMTLMTVPLAFALLDVEAAGGTPQVEPTAVLEAMRRYAGRTHIFCQAGGIYLPRGNALLLSHLEETVHEVTAPRKGGVFHPKVWVLRFVPASEEGPVLYRVLVLSRNLTFDRSWDTALCLDGELRDRSRAIRQSAPIGDFVDALPGMMLRTPARDLRAAIRRVGQEIRRVRFEAPAGFDGFSFHPIGLPDSGEWWFGGRIQRMLNISPFLDPTMLGYLADESDDTVLVSRPDQLRRIPSEVLGRLGKVYYLDQGADMEDDAAPDEDAESEPAHPLSGLHAKLYVADDGRKGRIWTGSANATSAAFERNVEFLVELTGRKSDCGVSALLTESDKNTRFIDLLIPYVPDDTDVIPDADDMAAERLKLRVREVLAQARPTGEVAAAGDNDSRFDVALRFSRKPRWPKLDEITIRVWPVTFRLAAALSMAADRAEPVVFRGCSFEALTAFFAFDVNVRAGNAAVADRFVLSVPLTGLPADRRERVLRALLQDRGRVLRFLFFLLAEEGDTAALAGLGSAGRTGEGDAGSALFSSPALFETMLAALHRDPARLDRVERLVRDLAVSGDDAELLPEGFMDIWTPLWAARQETRK